jgi:hypothetical protein
MADKIDDQGIFGAKDSVRIEVCVPFDEQVRREWYKTICRNEQVDMGRSERVMAKCP